MFGKNLTKKKAIAIARSFSLCEQSHSYDSSYRHIRFVEDSVLHPWGGAPGKTLCGAKLANGWDIRFTDIESVMRQMKYQQHNPSEDIGRICPSCSDAYLSAVI